MTAIEYRNMLDWSRKRRAKIKTMRARRMSYGEIGRELGITRQRVEQIFKGKRK